MRGRLPLHLLPILVGLGGILYSRQLGDTALQAVVVLTSVAISVFAEGNLLARLPSRRPERVVLIVGVILLTAGAMVTLSGLPDSLFGAADISETTARVSRWLGLLGLVLGLCVTLFMVAHSEEVIESLGRQFSYLAEHINEGLLLYTPGGIVTMANQRFLQLSGLEEPQVIGRNVRDLPVALHVDSMLQDDSASVRGLAANHQVTWHVRDEEIHVVTSSAPVRDYQGRFVGILCTVRDVSEELRLSRRVERYAEGLQWLVEDRTQKLRQSQERLRNLLMNMNEGFLTVDSALRVRFANARIAEMLQRPVEDLRGQDVLSLIDPTSRARLYDLLRPGVFSSKEGERLQYETNLQRIGGGQVPVVIAVALVRDESDTETGYSLVITDVTPMKDMQRQIELRARELEIANQDLRMIDRAKDVFLTNVSHELRTPLSTIRGYVEMLESGMLGDLLAPQQSALKVMMRNIGRLHTHIDEVIEFSRMEIRGTRLSRTLLSVERLVRDGVQSAQPQALTKNISISMHVPEGFCPVWGDRKRLGQLLSILLSNAVKFSHEGGPVGVLVGERDGHALVLSVTDAGIGIDPAYHDKVFDKFFQVDSSLSRRYEGAGIGLSIGKGIAQAHGGDIELDSEPGKGSTFTFVLPNALFAASFVPEEDMRIPSSRALVLLEDREFRAAVTRVLTSCGCAVQEVGRSYEGIRVAKEQRPDVIFIDETLPDMTGAATISRLQEEPSTSDIPVSLLLDRDSVGQPGHDIEFGEINVLVKPFTARELALTLRHLRSGREWMERGDQLPIQEPVERPPSVLVVDGDPDFMEWLRTALQYRRISCYCAADLQEAAERVRAGSVDVVFLDMATLGLPTAEMVAAVRGPDLKADVPVYMMTSLPDDRVDTTVVSGFLRKPFSINEMESIIFAARDLSLPT